MNTELGWIWKEALRPQSSRLSTETRETHFSQVPGQDSNQTSPEYKL
jgi:hypothetical protein